MDVTALLQKLRDGQKELESNVRTLTRRGPACKITRKEKVRARKLCSSLEQGQTSSKRARTVQLSPQPSHSRPRRLSSTPRAGDNVPSLDLSLENALRAEEKCSHDSKVRFAQDTTDKDLTSSSTSERHSFLVTQQQGGCSKIRSSGTNVSFAQNTAEMPQRSRDSRELGAKLVESLNASRFGALDSSLHRFPRHYKGDDPRLGYDWIAGMLDNEVSIGEKDDKYFEDIKEFRRVNRSECCQSSDTSVLPPHSHGDRPATPSLLNSSTTSSCCSTVTTCVSSYVLNDRLFPVPVHTHSEPGILCPVCEGSHDPDGTEREGVASIRYIKVSVPRCTLEPVSKLKAQRRRGKHVRLSGRSTRSTESMGLSKHCQAGWETAQPAVIPSQPSISLKSFLSDQPSDGNLHCPSTSMCKGGHTHQQSTRSLLNTSHGMHYDQLARGMTNV